MIFGVSSYDGGIYTLPRIQKASTSAKGQMYFRTDYLEEVGLDVPETVDEFYRALVAIKGAGLTDGYAPLVPYDMTEFENQTEAFLFAALGDSVD